MRIQINKDEVNNMKDDIMTTKDVIDREIDVWRAEISNLKQIWTGKDANVYYAKIDNYLKKLDLFVETSNTIGEFLEKANSMYQEKERNFTSELKKDNAEYEDVDKAVKDQLLVEMPTVPLKVAASAATPLVVPSHYDPGFLAADTEEV